MRELTRRLANLEARSSLGGILRWHRVCQREGQTEADAIAAYEAEHGPIGPGEGTILRRFVSSPFAAGEPSPCLH